MNFIHDLSSGSNPTRKCSIFWQFYIFWSCLHNTVQKDSNDSHRKYSGNQELDVYAMQGLMQNLQKASILMFFSCHLPNWMKNSFQTVSLPLFASKGDFITPFTNVQCNRGRVGGCQFWRLVRHSELNTAFLLAGQAQKYENFYFELL